MGPFTRVDLSLGAVEEVEAEVDQAARHRRSVHDDVFLGQVPAARPHDDRGEVLADV